MASCSTSCTPPSLDPQATLLAQNVEWDQNIISSLMADQPDPLLSQVRLTQSQPSFLAMALFKDLPSATHTYLMTLGTTADPKGLKVELLRGSYVMPEYTSGVSNLVRELGPDKLSATPGTNEVRSCSATPRGRNPSPCDGIGAPRAALAAISITCSWCSSTRAAPRPGCPGSEPRSPTYEALHAPAGRVACPPRSPA